MEIYFANPKVLWFLLDGFLVSLEIAALAILFSLAVGLLLAVLRLSRLPVVHHLVVAYIETIRPLPTFLILIVTYFGLSRVGIRLPSLYAAVVGLVAYHAAREAEVIRGGILSVEKGQTDAARSLGLSYIQTMRHVILPIGLKRMVPALTTEVLMVVQNVSLCLVLGVSEVMNRGAIIYSKYFNPVETLLIIAVLFWLVCYPMSRVSRRLEVAEQASAAL